MLLFLAVVQCGAQTQVNGPVPYVYAVRDTVELVAHVFLPPGEFARPRPALVVFHGGGWSDGDPSWGFGAGKRFEEEGLVVVCVEYRLSDHAQVTPVEAMADARDAIRWVRTESESLGVDPDRIAAYGWSAGGHLAAAAAMIPGDDSTKAVSPVPDALLLKSPAVALEGDAWFRELLLARAAVEDLSPDRHVRPGLPPALILQGDRDTVTPLSGVERFCRLLREAGNRCELKVYQGTGHLLTPPGASGDGWPRPDPEVTKDYLARMDAFLQSLGYLP